MNRLQTIQIVLTQNDILFSLAMACFLSAITLMAVEEGKAVKLIAFKLSAVLVFMFFGAFTAGAIALHLIF